MAPQAKIRVNGTTGSVRSVPLNTSVQLSNLNAGGETTYAWTIVDQPEGPADALSNAAIQNPIITPTKEGTYLFQLVVNVGTGTEQTDRQGFGILELKTARRVPAAKERSQFDADRGWAEDANRLWQDLTDATGDGSVITAQVFTGDVGQVVMLFGIATIKSGLPGEEVVPLTFQGHPNDGQLYRTMRAPHGIITEKVGGGGSVIAGDLCRVRVRGLWAWTGVVPAGTFSVGDPVYVYLSGGISNQPNAGTRVIARVLAVVNNGGTDDITLWVDGTPPPAGTVEIHRRGALANNEEVFRMPISLARILPKALKGAYGSCGVNPSGTTTIDFKKNGAAAFGSVSISTGGVFTFSAAALTTFTPGDVLTAVVNGNANSLADVGIVLVGG